MAKIVHYRFRDSGEISFLSNFPVALSADTRKNPYSGEEVLLSPDALPIYDFIIAAQFILMYMEGERGYKKIYTDFHRAIEIFRKKWPDEYMKLLD